MISRLRGIFGRGQAASSTAALRFNRPLVLFQSDDWGRVGVRDREGWNELRAKGVSLGVNPYDSYSLETADDLQALADVLKRHRDSVSRHPCIGMNFVMANVDFPRLGSNKRDIFLRPLTDGPPEPWRRPSLGEAYRQGIRERVFFPALHGLTHFCAAAVERELGAEGERRELLQTLWSAGTPYIHWRMPWIGYEYWDPSLPTDRRFLSLSDQRAAIQRATEIYREFFAMNLVSACAPGYRANQDTMTAWSEVGVRVVQRGPGGRERPTVDGDGMLFTFRNVELEPATEPCGLESVVRRANECLSRGLPATVSMHSINFHSTIRDFRSSTLTLLDGFLSAMEREWPELLYVNDGDLWHIATDGFLAGEAENIKVGVTTLGADR